MSENEKYRIEWRPVFVIETDRPDIVGALKMLYEDAGLTLKWHNFTDLLEEVLDVGAEGQVGTLEVEEREFHRSGPY